jgi:hypothetical protein
MGKGCELERGRGGDSRGRKTKWLAAGASVLALVLAAGMLLGVALGKKTSRAPLAEPDSSISNGTLSTALYSKKAKSPASNPKLRASSILGQLPLIFEPNEGQADSRVKFLARGAGYGLFLESTEATLSFQTAPAANGKGSSTQTQIITMTLAGANVSAMATGADPLPGKTNYILGNDPRKWHSGIPQFGAVRYQNVYPGIDLVFYGKQGRLEYDFRVAAGADPAKAELEFCGASKVELREGNLVFTGDRGGQVRLQTPQIYQRNGERQEPVSGRFVLRSGNRVGFEIGAYDRSRELVIDPVLDFSTYFGPSPTGSVSSPSVAVDGDGDIYVAGTTTSSSGFPVGTTTPTCIGAICPTGDIFVAKIDPSQPASVVYLTFLGGSGTDTSVGIGVAANVSGSVAYIVGNTTSTNFPVTTTAYMTGTQATNFKTVTCTGPCSSVFVSVLSASGAAPLAYSTYLAGDGNDTASGMSIDLSGDVYITGTTTSNNPPEVLSSGSDAGLSIDFPATQAPIPFQTAPSPGSTIQFFVTKVNTNLSSSSAITYSTYFGGSDTGGSTSSQSGGGVVSDTVGNIYFSGTTNFLNTGLGPYGVSTTATDFPIVNAYQPCLDFTPPIVVTSTYTCTSLTPPTPYPTDAFLAKINPNAGAGAQLQFSTYFGGSFNDSSTAIAIDSGAANIYITGTTNSGACATPPTGTLTCGFNTPTGSLAYQACLNDPGVSATSCPTTTTASSNTDAFIARFNNPTVSTTGTPNLVANTYFTYLGGGGNDSGSAIAVLNTLSTTLNDVVVTGATNSGTLNGTTPFPVTATCPSSSCVVQSTLNGPQNSFYAQINTTTTTGGAGATSGSYVTYFGGNGVDSGTAIAVDPSQNGYFVGQTTSSNLQTANPLQSALNTSGAQAGFIVKWGTATSLCLGPPSCPAPVISPAGVTSAGNQVTITYTVSNQGPDPASNITVSGTITQPATFNSASASSGTCGAPSGDTAVCQIPALQAGATTTVAFVVTPLAQASYQSMATVFASNNTSTTNTATQPFSAGAYTMTISPSAQTVAAGLQASYAVTVSPIPAYGNTVALSCSALPVGATCNFTTKSLVFNGPGSQSTVLNITTTAQPVPIGFTRPGHRAVYAFWLMVPGLAVWGLGKSKRRHKILGCIALCVLFALVFLQPSCGHTTPQPTISGTPSGTYPLTVNATSGSYTQTAPFLLTVTP